MTDINADYKNVGMGLGAMGNYNSETGSSTSVTAEFSPAVLFEGGAYHARDTHGWDCSYNSPILMASGDLRYNVVGNNFFGDLVTNVQGEAQIGMGGTPARYREQGLDLYGMVVGDLGAGVFYHEDASNSARASVTMETGIQYHNDGYTLLMLSPAVGLGSVSHYALKDGGKMLADSDALKIGGRARWIIQETLWLSAEGFYSPSLSEYAGGEKKRSWNTTEAALDVRYKFNDKWSIHGTGRVTSYESVTAASEGLSETSGAVTLMRELL